MPRFVALFACLLTVAGSTAVRAEDAGPAKDVPELQVLQHYHGAWDVSMAGNDFQGGESTAQWILGGRYLEQSGVMRSKDGNEVAIMTLFTFDTMKKQYRSWTFLSPGSTSQAEMTWDANAKTMKSVSAPDANGVRSTVTADFSTAGKERWRFAFTDRDGNQVGEMSGENTLRKEATPAKPKPVAKPTAELSPEQKPLERFLGTWKTEYRTPKAEWTLEEKTGSATMVFTRELGGQLVRERTKHADGTENTFLMLFDPQAKQYRAWWFSSAAEFSGQPNISTGQWDDAAKSFTWKLTDANGMTSTAQHRFVGEKLDWSVLVENPQKVTMFRMEGTSLRVKETK